MVERAWRLKKQPLNSHQTKSFCKTAIFHITSKKAVILFSLMLQSSSSLPALWINLTTARSCGVQVHSPCWVFTLSKGALRSNCGTNARLLQQLWPFSSSPLFLCQHYLFSTSPQIFPICIYHSFFFSSCGYIHQQLQKCSWHFSLQADRFVSISISPWKGVRR